MANQYSYFEHKQTLKQLISRTYQREELMNENIRHYAAKNRRAHSIYEAAPIEEVELRETAKMIMDETAKAIELVYEMKELIIQSRASLRALISRLIC